MRTITITLDTDNDGDVTHVANIISLVLGLSPFTYTVEAQNV